MTIPKRAYVLAALVMVLSIAALKMWTDDSWLGRGNDQSGSHAVTSEASSDAKEYAQTNPQATPSEMLPEAESQSHTDSQALISGPFFGAGNGNPQDGPQAVFAETVYDAGTIDAGTDLTHTFKVKNVGKTDLVIESVKPG